MRKLALFLAVIFMLPSLASCKKDSFKGKKITADSPWWIETVSEISMDEMKSLAEGDFIGVHPGFVCPDDHSVIAMFTLRPSDSGQSDIDIIRHYSYDGEMLGQIILNDYYGSEDFEFSGDIFTRGGKYYALIAKFDEQQESYVRYAYELNFEQSRFEVKDPIPLNYPELNDDIFSNVSDMTGVGDDLVYLVHNFINGKDTYQISVDDGNGFRTFTPDFGRNTEIESIGTFRSDGDAVTFIADILENSISKQYYCRLVINSFEFTKTLLPDVKDFNQPYVTSDGKVMACDAYQVLSIDPATGTSSEFLNFNDTYVFDNYMDARVIYATDDEVVLYRIDQNGFGSYSTARLIKLTKAAKNPNAGRKALVLAYFNWLDDAEYNAINAFNKSSTEYFIGSTDKYFKIAEGKTDDSNGDAVMAQRLHGQVNAMDMLISDIKSGTGPDLVIYNMEYEKLNNTAYMVDLTKRIESQESLHNGDYLDFVLSPNGRDGNHYRLIYEYQYDGFFVNTNFLDNDAKGLTFAQYDKIIEENNLGKSVLPEDDLSLLEELVKTTDCFSYDESGKLSLNTENFRAVAEYIASIPDNVSYDDGLLGLTNILADYYMDARGFALWHGDVYENHAIIGYPSPDGHAETINGTGIGITSSCSAQDGAWEFAMTLLSPESQRTLHDPVMKSIQKENLLDYIQSFNDDMALQWRPERLTDEFADWYIDQVSDAIVVPDINPTILMIMCEEMPAYFAGDKTLDEAIGVIENRINLLIREQG